MISWMLVLLSVAIIAAFAGLAALAAAVKVVLAVVVVLAAVSWAHGRPRGQSIVRSISVVRPR
jgi:uncharacterized membrane protein YtjA (UPF0391 family)